METWFKILQRLADGHFHSGEALAGDFGVSRAAIWKQLKQIRQLPGIEVHAVTGRGYRLAEPLELFNADALLDAMSGKNRARVGALHLLPAVDSSNAFLGRQARSGSTTGIACLAEGQQAGRGRRGRQWQSGFGRNIVLSLAWRFDLPLAAMSGFSLAAGVAVARALSRAGIEGHGLKWPNDVHLQGRKLAGLLVEAAGESEGPSRLVIGLGLNISLDAAHGEQIDQPWIDLVQAGYGACGRNRLAGLLLDELVSTCLRYQDEGLCGFSDAWQEYDLYAGRQVRLLQGESVIDGRYLGLAADGSLRLQTEQGEQLFQAGEVSLRAGCAA